MSVSRRRRPPSCPPLVDVSFLIVILRRLITECLSLDEGDRLLALSEGRGLLAVQHLAEGDVVEGLLLLLQLSRLILTREGAHQQLISNGGRFKLAFFKKDKKQTMKDLREISTNCLTNQLCPSIRLSRLCNQAGARKLT
jgi:hypothetical protein